MWAMASSAFAAAASVCVALASFSTTFLLMLPGLAPDALLAALRAFLGSAPPPTAGLLWLVDRAPRTVRSDRPWGSELSLLSFIDQISQPSSCNKTSIYIPWL